MASFRLDTTKAISADLYGAINAAKTSIRALQDHRNAFDQVLGASDKNAASSFTALTAIYGFSSDAETMNFYQELNSAVGNAGPAVYQLADESKFPK